MEEKPASELKSGDIIFIDDEEFICVDFYSCPTKRGNIRGVIMINPTNYAKRDVQYPENYLVPVLQMSPDEAW